MGLAASQARLLMLTDRECNLEFQGENVAEQRMIIANNLEKLIDQKEQLDQMQSQPCSNNVSANDIYSSMGSIIGNSELVQGIKNFFGNIFSGSSQDVTSNQDASSLENTIDDEIAKLQEEDKVLELKLKQIDTQHQAVQTELDSVEKVIQKNIEETFKLF
ncbi:MAG: hypothetical protein AB1782_00635 [Cyanobacteriota bacterium]